MRRRALAGLIAMGIAGCSSPTSPLADLNGTWVWSCVCPSGAGVVLSLSTVGAAVVGTG